MDTPYIVLKYKTLQHNITLANNIYNIQIISVRHNQCWRRSPDPKAYDPLNAPRRVGVNASSVGRGRQALKENSRQQVTVRFLHCSSLWLLLPRHIFSHARKSVSDSTPLCNDWWITNHGTPILPNLLPLAGCLR